MVFSKRGAFLSVFFLGGLGFLGAETNGAFLGAGFQYSYLAGADHYTKLNTTIQTPFQVDELAIESNLYGGDLQVGYKQFFGTSKRFGLRYYGMFSGHTGNYYKNGFNTSAQYMTMTTVGRATNFFYGVGMDALYNFYENKAKERSFGVFGGFMIGGSSWYLDKGYRNSLCLTSYLGNPTSCVSVNASLGAKYKDTQTKFQPTYVQFAFNLGFRLNFSKHVGVETGVRVPVINDPFFKGKNTTDDGEIPGGNGSTEEFAFRRTIVFFINYVANF
ncbi:outer membrane protein [Helicobacter felis]|uniref:outer membrane protein n=1 Tax=Helicobacter felis TaxID=214 RepID=UPI000CF0C250|nr:outer membrane protein [Helicobacter felis]